MIRLETFSIHMDYLQDSDNRFNPVSTNSLDF